ncbi:unnamed protein product, partial [Meganyctiphanes norvegica]
ATMMNSAVTIMRLIPVLVSFTGLVMAEGDMSLILPPSGYSKISETCGENFEGTEGSFSSPNYPNYYPDEVDCYWIVKTPNDTLNSVRVTFESFNTASNDDYLDIRDGSDGSATLLISLYGDYGSHPSIDVVSTGNNMYFHFQSRGDLVASGFKLNWFADAGTCYVCDNFPDTSTFDPTCGEEAYNGNTGSCSGTCYTNLHYDGSHRIERGCTKSIEQDGSCTDTGFSKTCFCTTNFCNTDLCQNCMSSTPSPTATTNIQPTITTPGPSITPTQSPATDTNPPTSNQPPTPSGVLECFSCFSCDNVDEDTGLESSEEFLTCFTAIELGTNHLVIRGGSPDYHEDGSCRHEGDQVYVCYCSTSRCNSDSAMALFSNQ